jgi:aminoglycoside 3-N-acetyltransferase
MSEIFNNNTPENPLPLTIENFEKAIRLVGIESGDLVQFYIAADKLGRPQKRSIWNSKTILEILEKIVGTEGTILIPSFSYSFCGQGEKFDPQTTPSKVGGVSNYIIQQGVNDQNRWKRSIDPLFSTLGKGSLVEELFHDLPLTSFGKDCLFERLLKRHAKTCMIGAGYHTFTSLHYTEWSHGVPYRFDKIFNGIIVTNKRERECNWTYFVRAMDPRTVNDPNLIHKTSLELGLLKRIFIGDADISACVHAEVDPIFRKQLDKDIFSHIQEPVPLDELKRLIQDDIEKSQGVKNK